MPSNSVRHQIMDAVLDGLETITKANGYQTDVKLVSEDMEDYEQVPKSNLPALFPLDTDEEREWAQLSMTSTVDLQAVLEISILCYVYDRNDKTRQQRTDLMRDVEKVMMNDTGLQALILYVDPVGVVTDKGTIPNFSVWDQTYKVTYRYNSEDGG